MGRLRADLGWLSGRPTLLICGLCPDSHYRLIVRTGGRRRWRLAGVQAVETEGGKEIKEGGYTRSRRVS